MIIWIILLSIVSGYLYRLGGSNVSKRPFFLRWKPRDVFGSLVTFGAMYLLGVRGEAWAWALAFGLTWGATSTYWDPLTGHDNFFLHGLGIGLAAFPLVVWGNIGWESFLIRSGALCLFMGFWCLIFGEDWVEEYGRGISKTLSTLLIRTV